MMDRPYLQHASRHGRRGSDPIPLGPWLYVGSATAWDGGTDYVKGDIVEDDFQVFTCYLANTGIEPGVDLYWERYWSWTNPDFQNGFANNGDGSLTEDQLTRFRLLLGGGIELQLNALGGAEGDIIFTFIDGYWEGAKQTIPGVDDTGLFVCLTFKPRDDGSDKVDVYAGRV